MVRGLSLTPLIILSTIVESEILNAHSIQYLAAPLSQYLALTNVHIGPSEFASGSSTVNVQMDYTD